MLHLLRNYSALIVVISSAFLVAVTNFAAGKETSGFLFGYFGTEDSYENPLEKKISIQASQQKSNLAMVRLEESSRAPDPTLKAKEEAAPMNLQGQALVSASSPIKKDPEEDGGVKIYEVQPGDNISSIAAKNKLFVNTILWANEIDNVDSIKPGDKIFILPADGLSYTIKKDDDLDSIATKYKAEKEKIIAFNGLPANGEIKEGQEIIIPEGQKEISTPSSTPSPATSVPAGIASRPYQSFESVGQGKILSENPKKPHPGGHVFPYGFCTWYIAQKRYIPWTGNAGTWLYKAKSLGYATGRTPKVGSIVVTTENTFFGHVAYVEKVSGNNITVSEMNFVGFAKTSRRTFDYRRSVVKGFIY